MFLGLPCGLAGKESACSVGDLGSIPGLERFPGEGKGYPLQCSALENSMDFTVHGIAKSWTRLSDFHFTYIQSGTQCWDTLRNQTKYLLLLFVLNYFYFKINLFILIGG